MFSLAQTRDFVSSAFNLILEQGWLGGSKLQWAWHIDHLVNKCEILHAGMDSV
jgi:Uri superfamily endonuclease